MGFRANAYPITATMLTILIVAMSHEVTRAATECCLNGVPHVDRKENSQLNQFRLANGSHSEAVRFPVDTGYQIEMIGSLTDVGVIGCTYVSHTDGDSLDSHRRDRTGEHASLFLRRIPLAFGATTVTEILFPTTDVIPPNSFTRPQLSKVECAIGRNIDDDLARIPLLEAAKKCRTDIAETILAAGTDVNQRDMRGRTALHFAVSQARLGGIRNRYGEFLPFGEPMQLIKALLAAGADVNGRDKAERSALHYAATQSGPEVHKVIDSLLNAGADIEARNIAGFTPLHEACVNRWPKTVKVFLDKGADVNTRSKCDATPLTSATSGAFLLGLRYREKDGTMFETVKALLDAGADVNARTKSGRTALGNALKRGKTDVAELLRAHGAKEE